MTSVGDALAQLYFSRLAHFTPSKNLPHILRDGALRSSKDLASNAPEYFSPTDRSRFDQHPDKLCCSFEYPNGYYLAQARRKEDYINYPDWVCLLLERELVLRDGTLFSPRNAAAGWGAYLQPGGDALLACFADSAGTYGRGMKHLRNAATDVQAETLVPGPVDLAYLRSIVVPSAAAALNETGRLTTLGLDISGLRWTISPTFFNKDLLSRSIRYGYAIQEDSWPPAASEGAL